MILQANQENIKKAATLLSSDELVAFPTETVYGLGANALSDQAVKKIFALKQRPSTNPLILHVATVEQAESLIHPLAPPLVTSRFKKLAQLWPGPLSIIVPKTDEISDLVSAGGKTVAIRIPNHSVALQLLEKVNLPIAAPSANKSFAVSPTSAEHVQESFRDSDLSILDGGDCEVGLESTVVDISGVVPRILRPGSISCDDIKSMLAEDCLQGRGNETNFQKEPVKSPGLFDLHYSPTTPLIFTEDLDRSHIHSRLGVLLFSKERVADFDSKNNKIVLLSENGNLEEVAKGLYKGIRRLDQLDLDLIVIDTCREDGIGAAIMDRLRRARHFD